MNKLDREARARILHLLCEGQSIRAVTRLTGASKNTVTKLVVDAGHACTEYQDRVLRNLPSKRVQVDEIWNFIYAKDDHVKDAKAAAERRWRRLDLDRNRRGQQIACELACRGSHYRFRHACSWMT